MTHQVQAASVADDFFNLFQNTRWRGIGTDVVLPNDAYGALIISVDGSVPSSDGYKFQLTSYCPPFQSTSDYNGAYLFMRHSGQVELRCRTNTFSIVGQATSNGLEIRNFSGGGCDGKDWGFAKIKLIENRKISADSTHVTFEGVLKRCYGNLIIDN